MSGAVVNCKSQNTMMITKYRFKYELGEQGPFVLLSDTILEDIRMAIKVTMAVINSKIHKRSGFKRRLLTKKRVACDMVDGLITIDDLGNLQVEIDDKKNVIISLSSVQQYPVLKNWIQKSMKKFHQIQALRNYNMI